MFGPWETQFRAFCGRWEAAWTRCANLRATLKFQARVSVLPSPALGPRPHPRPPVYTTIGDRVHIGIGARTTTWHQSKDHNTSEMDRYQQW